MIKKALNDCWPEICIEWARDGVELMQLLGKNDQDIIILDLNMPRKNGLEALKEIKSRPDLSHIPVVVLTTSDNESHILQAYRCGSSSYIRKPYDYTGLKDLMSTFKKYWCDTVDLPPKHLHS